MGLRWPSRGRYPCERGDLRTGPLALAVAMHLGVLALLLWPAEPLPSKMVARSIAVIDIAAPPGPAQPAKPPQPQPKPPTPPEPIVVPPPVMPLPVPSDLAVAMLETSAAQASGGACDLTAVVQEALNTSPAIQAVLPTIPRPSRSVANAVMIWDADWVDFGDASDVAARDTIRDVVAGLVAVASEACRLQPQAGPRLIYLALGERETIVLALGSGEWRWQDLLDTARPEGWVMAPSSADALPEKTTRARSRPQADSVAGAPLFADQVLERPL